MNEDRNHISSLLLVVAILFFSSYALPSEDKSITFSQGRVWLVASVLIAIAVYSFSHLSVVTSKFKAALAAPYNIILLMWLISASFSAAFSPKPEIAFLGSYWGQMGVIQFALTIIIFFIAQGVEIQRRHWQFLSYGVVILFLLTVVEAAGGRPLSWLPEVSAYPAVTIGQRGHLAGLYALIAGISLVRRSTHTFILAGLGIALCNNTSALIGYISVGLIYQLYYKNYLKATTVSIAITLSAFIGLTKTSELCLAIGLNRCIDTKNVGEDNTSSLRTRISLWQASSGMIFKRPLLGWGDEQYAAHWPEYLPADEADTLIHLFLALPLETTLSGSFPTYTYEKPDGSLGLGEVQVLSPHNTLLQEVQSHGLLGLSFLVASAFTLFRRSPQVIISLIGYGVYLLSWFPVFSVLPLAALLAGTMCNVRYTNHLTLDKG